MLEAITEREPVRSVSLPRFLAIKWGRAARGSAIAGATVLVLVLPALGIAALLGGSAPVAAVMTWAWMALCAGAFLSSHSIDSEAAVSELADGDTDRATLLKFVVLAASGLSYFTVLSTVFALVGAAILNEIIQGIGGVAVFLVPIATVQFESYQNRRFDRSLVATGITAAAWVLKRLPSADSAAVSKQAAAVTQLSVWMFNPAQSEPKRQRYSRQ